MLKLFIVLVILYFGLTYLHPDLEVYKQYVFNKCCKNSTCSLEGDCLKNFNYLNWRYNISNFYDD